MNPAQLRPDSTFDPMANSLRGLLVTIWPDWRPGGVAALPRRAASEAERAALGIAADRPALARMNHRPAKLDDARERHLEVGHLEVGQRPAVARPRPALMHAELHPARARMQTAPLVIVPPVEGRPEQPLPEAACPLEVISGELDQL